MRKGIKKEKLHIFLYIVAILLVIGFVVSVCVDYYRYDETWSAPSHIAIVVRGAQFLLPAIIVTIAGYFIKRRYSGRRG